jgi:hypothetical protein
MLEQQVPDPKKRERVAKRVAEWMVHHNMPASTNAEIRAGVLELAKRAAPLGFGGMHPALKAYAYIQALENGGAQT